MPFNPNEEDNAALLLSGPEINHKHITDTSKNNAITTRKNRLGSALCCVGILTWTVTWAVALLIIARDRGYPSAMSSEKYKDPGNDKTQEFFHEPNSSLSTPMPPPLPPSSAENSHLVEQLRVELASISIEMMQEDTAEKALQSQHIDITPLYNFVDKALDTIGVHGVYQNLFRSQEFASVLNNVASSKGLDDFEASYGHRKGSHPKIEIQGIPNDRSYLYLGRRDCTGCPFWLPHYFGAIIAEKLIRNDSLLLYGIEDKSDNTKFEDVVSFMKDLQMIQRRHDSDIMAFHVTHGFTWHYMASEMSDLDNYPIEMATSFCGELLWKKEFIEHVDNDIAKECRHGFGHGVFYVLAVKETIGHEAYSVQQQIRPMTLQLSDASLCKGFSICKKAPNQLSSEDCFDGFYHSLKLFGWKKRQTKRHYIIRCSKWHELAADVQAAAMDLGYDKSSWDNHHQPVGFNQDWDELSYKERGAAKKLDYDERRWSLYYDAYSFSKLPREVRGAATVLQYDDRSWRRGDEPYNFHQDWEDLEAKIQEAAKRLGYDEQSWFGKTSSPLTANLTSSDST